MIPPDVLMLVAELTATSGLSSYRSAPLSAARRHAQRLILVINGLSIPALIFAALGMAIFLSGKAPPLVGLIELVIIGLIIGVQVVLYRRLVRLRQIKYLDISAYQDSWLLITQAEELVENKLCLIARATAALHDQFATLTNLR